MFLASDKIVIYTAIFGNKWNYKLRDPIYKFKGGACDFLCITDNKNLKSDVWTVLHESQLPKNILYAAKEDPRLKSKIIKIDTTRSIPIFSNYHYQIYIWMDATFLLKEDPFILIRNYMKNADIMGFKHPRNKNIEKEALEASKTRGVDFSKALKEIEGYKKYGFDPEKQEAITSGGFLFRRHSRVMDCFNKYWLTQVLHGTGRDQLSLDFCIWFYELKLKHLPYNYTENPWVKFFMRKENA